MFLSDVAQRASKILQKVGTTPKLEARIASLICFDATMTDAVNSLANKVDVIHNYEVCRVGTEKGSWKTVEYRSTVPSRGGSVFKEISRKLRLLFPFAANNPL